MTSVIPVAPVIATELRLQRRHGLFAATLAMTGLWTVVLLALPEGWRAGVVAWVLFLDLATLGFFFVPALVVVERSNGVTAALRLTELRASLALAVRLATLAVGAVLGAAVVLVAAGFGWRPDVLVGVAITSALVSLVALLMTGRSTTLTDYVARVPLVAVPLLAPALLRGTGLWDGPILALSPMTGALDLLSGHWSWTTAAWLGVWVVGLWIGAVRIGFDVGSTSPPATERRTSRPADAPVRYRRRSAMRSLARADRRTLAGDRIAGLLVAGVLLTTLAVRWLGGAGVTWINARYDVDVVAHLPLVWAFVFAVHVPTMLAAMTGLLFLEDRDAGLLPAIATTRASLVTLLAYRLGATAIVTTVLVVVAVPLAGARHPAGPAGLAATGVVAGAVATVPVLLLAGIARDRVQGMALMKAISIPLYAPLAWWFVEGRVGWLFAPLPTAWAVRTFWAADLTVAAGAAGAGCIVSAVWGVVLARRLRRSAVGS